MALVYLSMEWGDLGLAGWGDCLFPKDVGSSFSPDWLVKAVCCAGSMWMWPVRDRAQGEGLLQAP